MLAVSVALVALLAPAQPAEASATGGLEFAGTASLPVFPCPLTASCEGSFEGTVTGQLTGDDGDVSWEATLTTAHLDATFVYHDANCTDGSATGNATIVAGFGDVSGTYEEDPLPRSVHGLSIDVTFMWDRDGPAADLTLRDIAVTLDVEGVGLRQVATAGTGFAVAAFAPLPDSEDPTDLPECTAPDPDPPDLDAVVEGIAEFSDSL